MKSKTSTWIFFFLFLLTASGVFAAMVENSHQGSLAISITSQPGSTENAAESHQGLTCIILNPVSVGAFISKDPIGFNGGMNLYRYADNNPMRWVDPMGFSSCSTPEYKTLLLNLIHVYNGTSVFPYDRSKIENSFNFVNDVSLFLIRDKAVQTNNTMGLIAWNNLNYNAATIEAFSAFGVSSNSDTEVINIILAETNFGPDLYGLTSPIGGRRALVDWNNGQHLGNPVNRSWTITHESGHALGLQHKAGTVMQQANWGDFHFDTAEQTAIEQTLEKQ